MPRQKTVYVQAINIRLHDHKSADYILLLKKIINLKLAVNYRSKDFLMITHIDDQKNDMNRMSGIISHFMEIDVNRDWLDLTTGDVANDRQLSQIIIPENLRPNLESFFFEFDSNLHLFTFQSYGQFGRLSAGAVHKFFEEALSNFAIVEEFGHSEVTIVADSSEIGQLFDFDRLTRITITIERPNSDLGSDDMERKILSEMEAEHARKVQREAVAEPGRSLSPSEDTKALARVAARNGSVKTHGQEGNLVKEKSTSDIPLREGEKFDPEVTDEKNAFKRATEKLKMRYK